jgi:diaminopimelate decarboxylase
LVTGILLDHIDLGGGLGVAYQNETPPSPGQYLNSVLPEIRKRNLKLVIEPGRSIIANAGILVTKVLFLKVINIKIFKDTDLSLLNHILSAMASAATTLKKTG